MTEALPVDLGYGHTGEATYDERRHEWHFDRVPGSCSQFEVVKEPIAGLKGQVVWTAPSKTQSAYSRSRSLKKLGSTYPELAPAANLIPSFVQESEVTEELAFTNDILRSELLTFGYVPTVKPDTSSTGTVPVAAIVGGTGGSSVRFVRMIPQQFRWRGNTNVTVNLITKGADFGSSWTGQDGPVQQLCFAPILKNMEAWLAIRYAATTKLVPLIVGSEGDLISPGLSLCHRLDERLRLRGNSPASVALPIQRTGGSAHADVTFNPWIPRQYAIVDQKARWSIWDLEARPQRKELWKTVRLASGHLHDELAENQEENDVFNDGWGRIIWLGNHTTVLVASRSLLTAFSINKPQRRVDVGGFGSAIQRERILDLERRPSDRYQVFVLTSTRILWLQSASSDNQAGSNTAIKIHVLLAWKHLRDPADLSLKLNVAEGGEDEPMPSLSIKPLLTKASGLLLYSRISGISTFFAFNALGHLHDLATTLCDPCNVPLPSAHSSRSENHVLELNERELGILQVVMTAVAHTNGKGKPAARTGARNSYERDQLYRLSVLKSDLSVIESVLAYSPPTVDHPGRSFSSDVPMPVIETYDDEILNTALGPGFRTQKDGTLLRNMEYSQDHETQVKLVQEDPWTIDMERIDSGIQTVLDNKKIIFTELLDSLNSELEQNPFQEELLPKTLIQFVTSDPIVNDTDIALDTFINSIERIGQTISLDEENVAEVEPNVGTFMSPALSSALGIGSELVPAAIYDNFVRTWLTFLPPDSSSRARIAMENYARSIVGQLCLSSYQYPFSRLRSDDISALTGSQGSREVELPLRRKPSATGLSQTGKEKVREIPSLPTTSTRFQAALDSSQTRALPTPELTPSLGSRNSFSSIDQVQNAASRRLGLLAQIPLQTQSPNFTSNILGHWAIGANPWKYDWDRTQRALESESKELQANTSGKSRSHEGLRSQKRDKRREKDNSSQVLVTVVGSQLQMGQRFETQGSSVASQPMVTMSQVEPGVHGGRKKITAKKNAQKRVAGFR